MKFQFFWVSIRFILNFWSIKLNRNQFQRLLIFLNKITIIKNEKMTFSWIKTNKEHYHMQFLIQNKPRKFRCYKYTRSQLKYKKEIPKSHIEIKRVQVCSKYQKVLILTLIKLKVTKAKAFVSTFKNMKSMKTIFQMTLVRRTLYNKLKRFK